jgi:hypothetical protein
VLVGRLLLPIAPVESKPVSPAPDGGKISFAVAGRATAAVARVVGVGELKRCAFLGSVSEGWNSDRPVPCARATVPFERWTNAIASAASATARH